jgi:hypothetical protein
MSQHRHFLAAAQNLIVNQPAGIFKTSGTENEFKRLPEILKTTYSSHLLNSI